MTKGLLLYDRISTVFKTLLATVKSFIMSTDMLDERSWAVQLGKAYASVPSRPHHVFAESPQLNSRLPWQSSPEPPYRHTLVSLQRKQREYFTSKPTK